MLLCQLWNFPPSLQKIKVVRFADGNGWNPAAGNDVKPKCEQKVKYFVVYFSSCEIYNKSLSSLPSLLHRRLKSSKVSSWKVNITLVFSILEFLGLVPLKPVIDDFPFSFLALAKTLEPWTAVRGRCLRYRCSRYPLWARLHPFDAGLWRPRQGVGNTEWEFGKDVMVQGARLGFVQEFCFRGKFHTPTQRNAFQPFKVSVGGKRSFEYFKRPFNIHTAPEPGDHQQQQKTPCSLEYLGEVTWCCCINVVDLVKADLLRLEIIDMRVMFEQVFFLNMQSSCAFCS